MKYKENIIKWNLEKYNYTKEIYNKYQVQLFMENANTHLISTFKDFLFYDDFTEFLSKYYFLKDSLNILIPLLTYYEKSSYIFPNYTILNEGKYIYKNIIKKQILINYLEDLELKKRQNINNFSTNKNQTKYNSEKIFDTQLYNNLLINNNNDSNLNILFGIKINKNKNNNKDVIKEDSICSFKKLINAISESNTKSVGTNTINITSYNNKKIKKGKKRNNISPKAISNSTNYTTNISNTNANSMFKINKKIIINNNNINKNYIFNNQNRLACITLEKNINSLDNSSNYNFNTQKNLKRTRFQKSNGQKKINSFLTYFNSSFMKPFLAKLNEKKVTSDKNVLNIMKTKNKTIKNRKHVLTPIDKIKHHISISSFILKNSKINKYLTHLPSTENSSKNNLKYKKIKVKNGNNKIINSHNTSLKSKIFENKNKGVLIKDNNHLNHHQRNNILNFECNYNSKITTYSISLNNSIYKTMNMNNMKKSSIPLTQYRKNRKISLCNEIFKNDTMINTKKFFTKNISKTKITNINITEEDKKKNRNKKNNKIYFKTKLPSPLRPRRNLRNNQIKSLNKNKNNSLFKDFKTLHKLKYFPKKNISDLNKK